MYTTDPARHFSGGKQANRDLDSIEVVPTTVRPGNSHLTLVHRTVTEASTSSNLSH